MDKFISEAEQAAGGFGGQGNQNQQDSTNNNDQQSGQQGNNQQQPQQQSSGGNSLMGGMMQAGEDGALNTELNSLMTKEGLPAGADGAVDAFVDKEANQFLGGNKNFWV